MLNFDVASKAAVQIPKDRCRKYLQAKVHGSCYHPTAVFYEKQTLPRFFYFLRTAKKFIEDCSIHVQFPKLI